MAGNSNAKTKAPKKGSNLLCRIANPTPKKVCEFVRRMPKHKMPEEQFRRIMGKEWFANEHQAPEQWGLYYIDGEYFYPRFNREISLKEAEIYLSGWLKRFIVINPYTKFKTSNDNGLVLSIVQQLELNPNVNDLKTIMTNIIGNQEPFVINDILVNTLNTYSEVLNITIQDKNNEIFTVNLVPNYKEIINKKYNMTKKEYFELFDGIEIDFDPNMPLQQITYGAPGTGKSHGIKEATKGHSVIRTTFHPDSDYSTFVGAYKPVMEDADVRVVPVVLNNGASFDQNNGTFKEKRISYKFVKQAFLKAYLGAWKKYAEAADKAEPQFLVIEEINRGNCAQIFGDLFQLLDRNDDNNFSTYPIEADTDLQKEIEKAFKDANDGESENPYKLTKDIEIEGAVEDYTSNYDSTLSEDVQHGRVLLFPPNLYIWATMNTSDQSLFPIDSAFKRRWAWDYIKITDGKKGWMIQGADYSCDWWTFIQEINKKIATATSSDDKKLGYFFCKAKKNETVIDEKTFVSKVIFYLWNDVFKDNDNTIFKVTETNGEPSFDDFYMENEIGEIVTNSSSVKKFLINVVEDKNVVITDLQSESESQEIRPSEQEASATPED